MSAIPWDDVFCHLSEKYGVLQQSYARYLRVRDDIELNGGLYHERLRDFQVLLFTNHWLLLTLAASRLSDTDYREFLREQRALPPVEPKLHGTIEAFQITLAAVGVGSVGKVLWNSYKLIKGRLGPKLQGGGVEEAGQAGAEIGEGLEAGIAEMGAEAAIEMPALSGITAEGDEMAAAAAAEVEELAAAATEAGAAASTGEAIAVARSAAVVEEAETAVVVASRTTVVGLVVSIVIVVVCFGLDMLLGYLQGLEEEKQIAESQAKMKEVLTKIEAYSGTISEKLAGLERALVEQIEQFQAGLRELSGALRPHFEFEYPATLASLPDIMNAAGAARVQYDYLNTIRDDWVDMTDDDPELEWEAFARDELDRRPAGLTVEQATGLLEFARTRSGPVSPEGTFEPDPGASTDPSVPIEGTLTLRLHVRGGWYVFASVPPRSAHPATEVTLTLPAEVEALGALQAPASEPLAGQAQTTVIRGQAQYAQRVRLQRDGGVVEATVSFQACRAAGCQDATSLVVRVPVTRPEPAPAEVAE
ncbi:MAG: hypothetical protein H6828_02545 [Planctomycetes bacterium]|nr:hypothetical protein [Planctomycetota bacterium]